MDKKILKEGPGSLNSTVANNTASDGDNGLNGTVEYMIADGNNEVKLACFFFSLLRTFWLLLH